jgi:spermidine synthase
MFWLVFLLLGTEAIGEELPQYLYRNNLENQFLAASTLPRCSDPHRHLVSRQWSLALDRNGPESPSVAYIEGTGPGEIVQPGDFGTGPKPIFESRSVYHEMMAHVPLMSHGTPESVLIIGSNDGGILREVLRHSTVKRAVLVETDSGAIDQSKHNLYSCSKGAFEDLRVTVVAEDAAKFVQNCSEQFDVILCDSTDPFGPGQLLLTSEFYGACKKLLKHNGILVNQNGVPFLQKEELGLSLKNRQPHFKHVSFYVAPIPNYVGGFMAFGWASDKKYRLSEETLRQRVAKIEGDFLYYCPEIHRASFALPAYMQKALLR